WRRSSSSLPGGCGVCSRRDSARSVDRFACLSLLRFPRFSEPFQKLVGVRVMGVGTCLEGQGFFVKLAPFFGGGEAISSRLVGLRDHLLQKHGLPGHLSEHALPLFLPLQCIELGKMRGTREVIDHLPDTDVNNS